MPARGRGTTQARWRALHLGALLVVATALVLSVLNPRVALFFVAGLIVGSLARNPGRIRRASAVLVEVAQWARRHMLVSILALVGLIVLLGGFFSFLLDYRNSPPTARGPMLFVQEATYMSEVRHDPAAGLWRFGERLELTSEDVSALAYHLWLDDHQAGADEYEAAASTLGGSMDRPSRSIDDDLKSLGYGRATTAVRFAQRELGLRRTEDIIEYLLSLASGRDVRQLYASLDLDSEERLARVVSAFEGAGWALRQMGSDGPTFERLERDMEAPVPSWPLRSTTELSFPDIPLASHVSVHPNERSSVQVIAHKRLVEEASPAPETRVIAGDEERLTIALTSAGGWDVNVIRLKVNGGLAQNAVVAWLLDLSLSNTIGFLLVPLGAIFQDEIKANARRLGQRMTRRRRATPSIPRARPLR